MHPLASTAVHSDSNHSLPHGLHFTTSPPGSALHFTQPSSTNLPDLSQPHSSLLGNLVPPGYRPSAEDDLKSAGSRRTRRSHSSGSSFSSRSASTSRSSLVSSSSGYGSGKRKTAKGRRGGASHNRRRGSSSAAPQSGPPMFNQSQNVQSIMMSQGIPPSPLGTVMTGMDNFPGNPSSGHGQSFPPTPSGSAPHQLYGYPTPILGNQPNPGMPVVLPPQFGGMVSGLTDPTGFGASSMFTGPRGTIRPGLHGTGHRFMIDSSIPHPADESLQTYKNACDAPNRLPAHKPVRLTQPKHPLAPPGTPVSLRSLFWVLTSIVNVLHVPLFT